MTEMKINEQIAFLRNQKGLTQEEVANALGVTNQAVSKWESAQCCPDIQLLPAIAKLFDVTIDVLMGYKASEGLGDICLKLRNYFTDLPEKESFEQIYRITALLHEIAVTDGYKKEIPWKGNKEYAIEEIKPWGVSVCSEPEGTTGRKGDGVFFSLVKGYKAPKASELFDLFLNLERFRDFKTLKVMYTLYGLTLNDFDLFVTCEEIAGEAHLAMVETEEALKNLPLTVKEENGGLAYRLEGSFCHIPSLLAFLY